MALTIDDLTNATWRELNEATNSTLASVGDGTGADEVVAGTTLREYFTWAGNEWCETAWPLYGSATVAEWAIGVGSKGLHELTNPSDQGRLHAVLSVAMGDPYVPLARIDPLRLRDSYPSMEFEDNDTPLYFWEEISAVGVYPRPSAAMRFKAHGLALPPPVVEGTTSLSYMPDDIISRVIPTLAAILIAQKAYDDPSVFGRLDHLVARYSSMRENYRGLLSPGVLGRMKISTIQPRKK